MIWVTCLWRDRAGIQSRDRLLKPFPAGSGEFPEEKREMPPNISFAQLVTSENSAISPESSKNTLKEFLLYLSQVYGRGCLDTAGSILQAVNMLICRFYLPFTEFRIPFDYFRGNMMFIGIEELVENIIGYPQ